MSVRLIGRSEQLNTFELRSESSSHCMPGLISDIVSTDQRSAVCCPMLVESRDTLIECVVTVYRPWQWKRQMKPTATTITTTLFLFAAVSLAACDAGSGVETDAGLDAGLDARIDTGDSIDIIGLGNDEAATLLAEAECAHAAECGFVVLSCDDGVYSGQLVDVDFEKCKVALYAAIKSNLDMCSLTDEQKAVVNGCANANIGTACLTQEELDQQAEMFCNGEEPVQPPMPPSCIEQRTIFDAC